MFFCATLYTVDERYYFCYCNECALGWRKERHKNYIFEQFEAHRLKHKTVDNEYSCFLS